MAKQQCSSTCCCNQARRPVATLCRWEPTIRLTPELLDEIREFIEEEHGRISEKIVSNRFTLSRTSRKAILLLRLRPLVIRTVPHLEDHHIRDRCKFVEEMLARLALASGRRISRKIATSRRLNLDVICFSDEKIFRVDAAAPGGSFHTFCWGKLVRRNNATPPFRDTPCESGSLCYVAPLLSHFSRHIPPRSGLPLHGYSSPRCCVAHSLTRLVATRLLFCRFLSAIHGATPWSSCPLSAHSNGCVISVHVCLSRQTALDTSSSHPCTELHDLVTLHGSSTMFMPRLNM